MSDKFLKKAEPLIPKVKRDKAQAYQRRKEGGRKPVDFRRISEVIVYVLRTGIQWKTLHSVKIMRDYRYEPKIRPRGEEKLPSRTDSKHVAGL